MTGRKSICVLCLTLSAWILFIQPFQLGYGKSGALGFDHPPCCPSVSPGVRSGWVCAIEEESSAMGRNVMAFIPICILLVNGRIFTSGSVLSSAFNFTLWTAVVICRSGKGGGREVTLIRPDFTMTLMTLKLQAPHCQGYHNEPKMEEMDQKQLQITANFSTALPCGEAGGTQDPLSVRHQSPQGRYWL